MHSLEREYADLRARRVGLRNAIKQVAGVMMLGGPRLYEERQQLETLQLLLKGTDRRWAELGALLGRPDRPPVSLALPRTAVRYAPAQRRAPVSYVNRMIITR